MIQLKSICVILFILPIFCKGQSICIDSSTLKNVNIYLIKGAKAREEVSVYKKLHFTDSVYILHQDSILQNNNIEEAEIYISNSIKLNSNYAPAYSNLGNIKQIKSE